MIELKWERSTWNGYTFYLATAASGARYQVRRDGKHWRVTPCVPWRDWDAGERILFAAEFPSLWGAKGYVCTYHGPRVEAEFAALSAA